MSAITSGMAMQLAILFMLSIMGGRSVAMDETASSLPGSSSSSVSSGQSVASSPALVSSMQGPRFGPLVDARIPLFGGKRSLAYRAEFKRLPLYQFGLGKRGTQGVEDKRSQRYSFGVGKRTKGYSFGLGKRTGLDEADIARLSYAGYLPREFYDAYAQRNAYEGYLPSKRSGRFNFGLGKRDLDLTGEDDEKMPAKHLRDKYLFGLGKRFYDEEEDDNDDQEELS